MDRIIERPQNWEYPAYAEIYMKWVPADGKLLQHLWENFLEMKQFVDQLPPDKLLYRYDEGKWTVKEVLVHIIDDERIYAYRALSFARHEQKPLPGFDQEDYANYSDANDRPIENIMDEYEAVRNATIALFNGLSDAALVRFGTANKNRATVRALGYHIAGHELHHLDILRSKYYSGKS